MTSPAPSDTHTRDCFADVGWVPPPVGDGDPSRAACGDATTSTSRRSETLEYREQRADGSLARRGRYRLSELEQAVIALRMIEESLTIPTLSAKLGWSESHLKNVLAGRRGFDDEHRDRLWSAVVSPWCGTRTALLERDPAVSLRYRPYVSPRHTRPARRPSTHVRLDKLVLGGKLDASSRLRVWPMLQVTPGQRSAGVGIRAVDGRVVPVVSKRSEADFWKFGKRFQYRSVLEIHALDGSDAVVAFLAVGAYRRRCARHQSKPGAHKAPRCTTAGAEEECPSWHFERVWPPTDVRCGSCAWTEKHWRRCPRCRRLNRCAECERLSARNPDFVLEITGKGLELGLGVGLSQTFFAPYAVHDSVRVREAHLAVDIDVPGPCAIPFASTQTRYPIGKVRSHTNIDLGGPACGALGGGVTYGRPGHQVVGYDKRAEVRFKRCDGQPWRRDPPGTESFSNVYRLEFRLKPSKIDSGDSPSGFFERLRPVWRRWALADLRHVERLDIEAYLLAWVKMHGLGLPPTEKTPKRRRRAKQTTEARDEREASAPGIDRTVEEAEGFGVAMLRRFQRARMSRRRAFRHASALQAAAEEALEGVASRSGIDIGATVDAALPRLQQELDEIVWATEKNRG